MSRKSSAGSVRIIAGQWRGRKLPVADLPGLRPSGDRARETLFNWLASQLPGAVCADLFAGTGALGFEAASRGASQVVLVENNRLAFDNLERFIQSLGARDVEIAAMDALAWLKSQQGDGYDIIFADPPFDSGLHADLPGVVAGTGCLKPGGLLYIESPVAASGPRIPRGWALWKEKRIGEVRMTVLKCGT